MSFYQIIINVGVSASISCRCFIYNCRITYYLHEQEQLERKKARYGEIMRNKIALVHKEAEEKRAMIEAKRGEEVLKVQEMAAKYRATGTTPKKTIGYF